VTRRGCFSIRRRLQRPLQRACRCSRWSTRCTSAGKATVSRRRDAAHLRLNKAATGLEGALDALRQLTRSDLLVATLHELAAAIAEARAAGCDEGFVSRHEGAHTSGLQASERLALARYSLEESSVMGEEALRQLEQSSDETVAQILSDLRAAVAIAELAFVDAAEVAAARSVHDDLQAHQLHRDVQSTRLSEVLARLSGPGLLMHVESAIEAARAARVEEAVVNDATRIAMRVAAIASIDEAVQVVEAALGRQRRLPMSPEKLEDTLPLLDAALAEAEAAGVDELDVLEPARELLEVARAALSRHHDATARLASAYGDISNKMRATSTSSGAFEARLSRVGELTQAAKELEEALFEAIEHRVPEAKLHQAQAALSRARDQTRRFV